MRLIYISLLIGLVVVLGIYSVGAFSIGKDRVLLFVDKTLQRPVEELVDEFNAEYGLDIDVVYIYGSSGRVLSQLELYGRGDIYIADGGFFLDDGVSRGLIVNGSAVEVGYLPLSLLVAKGNPKGINGVLDALVRDDVVLAMGNPEHVVSGVIVKEILEEAGLWRYILDGLERGRVVYADSASKAASYVKLGVADCALTFGIFGYISPQDLDMVSDPLLDGKGGDVVVALASGYSGVGEELYRYILSHLDVFYGFGVERPE